MSKISIIVPVYNTAPYLRRCLNSLVNQTLQDIEIICVDDCSTDNSLEILKEYKDKIKVISLQKNAGVSKARNLGIETSCGEYLAFVDSDDYVDLNFYEELYKKAISNNAKVVKSQKKIVLENGEVHIDRFKDNDNVFEHAYSLMTAIYSAELIKKNNIKFLENLTNGEDCVFLNSILLNVEKVYTVQNTFYYYCRRQGSLDCEELSFEKIESIVSAIKIMIDDVNKAKLYTTNKEIYLDYFVKKIDFLILYVFFRSELKEARKLVAQTMCYIYSECKLGCKTNKKIYKNLFKYLKRRDITKIIKEVEKNNNVNFYRKIFSIYNEYVGSIKYKIIWIFGVKIKFRKKNIKS